MNTPAPSEPPIEPSTELLTDFLILGDGTLLVHNLTPAMATILQALNPRDQTLKCRELGAPEPASPR